LKLICVQRINKQEEAFYVRPDTALLRNNAAFYYPDFIRQLTVEIALILRISRLGCSIYERFASRYYNAVGAGVLFTAADALRHCITEGKPWGSAVDFDYSAAVSPEFIDIEEWRKNSQAELRAYKKNEIPLAIENVYPLERAITYVSSYMTLRTGDYIFIPLSLPFEVQKGERIEIFFKTKKMIEVEIK
jgi:2-keto-4-pentenoate hydratase/2-oxohepta-3-ene-1,7-dioic acid hydratase in catechol pathway